VFSQHCKSLRGLGVAEAKITAVPHRQVSDRFDVREQAAYADCLALEAGRTPDAVFDALKGFLSDEDSLELSPASTTCMR
jgi:alkylhydroperoxidase family enzyme